MHHPTNTLIGTFLMAAITVCSTPNPTPGEEGAWFDEVRWKHRLMVVSGPSDDVGPQLAAGKATETGYLDRELLLIDASREPARLVVGSTDNLPRAATFRQRFGMPEDTFQVVLVGKDGGPKERRDQVFESSELFEIIDAMPMRIREMREDLDTD